MSLQPIAVFVLLATLASTTSALFPLKQQSSTCASNTYPPLPNSNTTALPVFVVNLDVPPAERWSEIGAIYAAKIKALVEFWRDSIRQPWLRFLMTNGFDALAPRMLARSIPSEYYLEMRGIANATKLPFGQILMFNLFYELEALSVACTSIVARTVDGTSVTHARNLDFGNYGKINKSSHEWRLTELMRPLEISVEYKRKNQTLMRSTNFAGYVGVLTAVKPHGFSLTVNTRHDNRTREDLLWWLLSGGARTADAGHWVGFANRLTFEQVDSFEAARALLGTYKLITPVYLTLAGTKPDEGCVLSRAAKEAVDERCLTGTGRNATQNPWFVLQTNFDWWKVSGDGRQARGVQCMEEKNSEAGGKGGASPAELFDVLSSNPVFNIKTLYTSLMSANEGTLESYSRVCSGDAC